MSGGGKSSSDPVFFPGQFDAAGQIFEQGGLFEQIMQGRPNAGFERAVNTGSDRLQRTFAQRGLTGSGIEAKGLTEFEQGAAQQLADNQEGRILNFAQPAGTSSDSNMGSVLGITK